MTLALASVPATTANMRTPHLSARHARGPTPSHPLLAHAGLLVALDEDEFKLSPGTPKVHDAERDYAHFSPKFGLWRLCFPDNLVTTGLPLSTCCPLPRASTGHDEYKSKLSPSSPKALDADRDYANFSPYGLWRLCSSDELVAACAGSLLCRPLLLASTGRDDYGFKLSSSSSNGHDAERDYAHFSPNGLWHLYLTDDLVVASACISPCCPPSISPTGPDDFESKTLSQAHQEYTTPSAITRISAPSLACGACASRTTWLDRSSSRSCFSRGQRRGSSGARGA